MNFLSTAFQRKGLSQHSVKPLYRRGLYSATVLRPYQEACLQACRNALASGTSRIGVSLPTGSGKTTVFLTLIGGLSALSHNPSASRALVIVNSIELARQAATTAHRLFPHLHVEIEQGPKHQASGTADITVATYQTLLRSERIAKFDPHGLKVIVVDEAHHAASPSYRRILAHFNTSVRSSDLEPFTKTDRQPTSVPIIGFSATFSRHDGLALGSVFEQIVYHQDLMQMIEEEWLCNVRFTCVRASLNLKDVSISEKTGDFVSSSLARVLNSQSINNLVVQTYLDKAGEYGQGYSVSVLKESSRKSTIVFCINLDHLRELTDAFRRAGIDARYIHSGTPAQERLALVTQFRSSMFPVLLNVGILTEGADIPNIDCILIVRPTRSRNLFVQMIGRGMRLSPDTAKIDCHVIEFVDISNSVQGIISAPTLFGLDPTEIVDDETADSLSARAADITNETSESEQTSAHNDIPDPKSVRYTEYDNPFELFEDTSGGSHVHQMSPNAWVGCGGEIYVLECLGHGTIRIEQQQDDDGETHYSAHYIPTKAFEIQPKFLRKRSILTAKTLDQAIRGCDTYAASKVVRGPQAMGLRRYARWRKDPATLAQKAFIAKRLSSQFGASDDPSGQNVKLERLTKGHAANIITKLRNGAVARHMKAQKVALQMIKVSEKERLRQERERVKVGPLRDFGDNA